MNDSPKIHGFTFRHPPKPIQVFWEPQYVQHRLADGSLKVYNKGFILKGVMSWGENGWIDNDDYSNVVAMYNQLTATCVFYPRPNTYASRKFNVQIVNELDFTPHGGDLQTDRQLYGGSIVFESSPGEITSTTREIF